jgi:hypothetical protein
MKKVMFTAFAVGLSLTSLLFSCGGKEEKVNLLNEKSDYQFAVGEQICNEYKKNSVNASSLYENKIVEFYCVLDKIKHDKSLWDNSEYYELKFKSGSYIIYAIMNETSWDEIKKITQGQELKIKGIVKSFDGYYTLKMENCVLVL